MAFQVQRCAEWNRDALHVVVEPPWEKKGNARKARLRAQTEESSSLSNESANGANMKVSLSDRWKGLPAHFVATPRFSSFLRLTRRRHHELRMRTRDRVFLSISDWVFTRVKDPLVEIDPVTVNKAIMAESEVEKKNSTAEDVVEAISADSTVASTSPFPSRFGYLPPGFPKGAKGAAFATGVVLLLAALGTAAILALRRSKTPATVTLAAESNGGAREEVGNESGYSSVGFSRTESDKAVRLPQVAKPSFESAFMPIPSYSSSLDQSDLPLPPSLSSSARPGKKSPSADTSSRKTDSLPTLEALEDDLVVSFKVPLNDETCSEADIALEINEDIINNNGGTTAEITVVVSTPEFYESASSSWERFITGEPLTCTGLVEEQPDSIEELPTGVLSPESQEADRVHPFQIEEHASAESIIGELPSTAGSDAEEVYILLGDSPTLSIVGELHVAEEAITAFPAPTNSSLVDAFEPPKDLPSELVGVFSAAAQEGVLVSCIMSEDLDPEPSQEELRTAETVQDKRRAYTKVLEKVLPAVSVGAGAAALSSLSGVDGAFQMVGLLATANFLTRDFLWAGQREKLFKDIQNIKDHKQLIQFLKSRHIISDSFN